MSVAPSGVVVATVADLTSVVTRLTEKLEEQKRWTQTELDLLRQDQTEYAENTTESFKSLRTVTRGHTADITELKKRIGILTITDSTTTDPKDTITTIVPQTGNIEELINKCREDSVKDLNAAVQNMNIKIFAAETGIQTVRDALDAMNSETIPDVRKQLENECTKRRGEDLRLDRQDNDLRSQLDIRCEEIITALKKDIDNEIHKITATCATKDRLEDIQRNLQTLTTSATTQFSSIDDNIDGLKQVLKMHMEETGVAFDKSGNDIKLLMKDGSEMKSVLHQLTQQTRVDFKTIREALKDQISLLQNGLSEARAAAAQSAVNNERNIQAVASEVAPLKEARSMLFDKLMIKEVATLVREWKTDHVPATKASLSDLEARVARLKQDLFTEHEHRVQLQQDVTAVRSHFKMFHSIASGLELADLPPKLEV